MSPNKLPQMHCRKYPGSLEHNVVQFQRNAWGCNLVNSVRSITGTTLPTIKSIYQGLVSKQRYLSSRFSPFWPNPFLNATIGQEVQKPERLHQQDQEQLLSTNLYLLNRLAQTIPILPWQWNTMDHLYHYHRLVFYCVLHNISTI